MVWLSRHVSLLLLATSALLAATVVQTWRLSESEEARVALIDEQAKKLATAEHLQVAAERQVVALSTRAQTPCPEAPTPTDVRDVPFQMRVIDDVGLSAAVSLSVSALRYHGGKLLGVVHAVTNLADVYVEVTVSDGDGYSLGTCNTLTLEPGNVVLALTCRTSAPTTTPVGIGMRLQRSTDK